MCFHFTVKNEISKKKKIIGTCRWEILIHADYRPILGISFQAVLYFFFTEMAILGRCAAGGFGWSKVGNAWLIFQWNISFSSHSSESVLVEVVVVGPGSRGDGSVAWRRCLAAAAGPITGQQQVWPSRSFIYLAVWAAAVGRWKILRDLDENASPSRSKLHHQC